jgi:uncharacterized protein YecT (DUF1311 family)
MPSFRSPLRLAVLLPASLFAATLSCPHLAAQTIPSADAPPAQEAPPPPPPDAQQTQRPQPPPIPLPPPPPFDTGLFQNRIPAPALGFLTQFNGAPSGDLYRDRQFKHIVGSNIPNCMFHYGRDMPLSDALDNVLPHSQVPVQIRDNRYVLVSGETKDRSIAISQLPPAFQNDLIQWSTQSGVAPVTTRYFLTGNDKRILLEHNEDYCAPGPDPNAVPPAPDVCTEMNADAAEVDMNAAYYLEQVNYATNATAWMIQGDDQAAWIAIRDRTCVGPNPLPCRIRMTRERTRVIVTRNPIIHVPHR